MVYRETVTKVSDAEEGKSPNRHNSFFIKIEPLDDETFNAIERGDLPEGRIKKKSNVLQEQLMKMGWD